MQKSQCKSFNYVFFSLLKIIKTLQCIYNALCLSKLDAYKLYKSNKLKQTGWQDPKDHQQREARNPSLGATNDKESLQTYKGKWQPTTARRQTGKTDPKTLITDMDQDTLTHNPK